MCRKSIRSIVINIMIAALKIVIERVANRHKVAIIEHAFAF